MLTSSISNTKWCPSVGESCNFMDYYILDFVLVEIIVNDLGNLVLFMADVIAMLPCSVVNVIPLVDVVTYLYGWCCHIFGLCCAKYTLKEVRPSKAS